MSGIPQKEFLINLQNSSSATLFVQFALLSAGDWGSGPTDQPCIGDEVAPGDGRKYKTTTNFVSSLIGQIQLTTTGSGILTINWQWEAQNSLILSTFIQNAHNIDVCRSVSGDTTTKIGFVTIINSSFSLPVIFADW